jgi:DNA-binding CsgD family transcriptional regulator
LQDAAETFRAKGQTAKEAKVIYHLGKAYLAEEQDSLAFDCFNQAANEFLYLSDSVYYPLSVIELSLIAERRYREEGDATMLQAIRTIHREVIQTKTTNARKHNVLILLLTLVVVGCGIAVYAIYRSNKTFTKSVKREDLERNIALVLSQGKLQTALHWDDYQQFCSTANAYLYDAVDKLQAAQPELSEQDIRFCVLVLLDLSAKEIADIMMLSQNSISNKKTRTAQKLGTIAADLREQLISITLKTKEK